MELPNKIQVIEYDMMDKRKLYPFAASWGMCLRGLLYPFTLIKTRIMVQTQNTMYKGTFDAYRTILREEGVRGLYRGFWINTLLVVPQMTYITVYEGTRQNLVLHTRIKSSRVRALIAGGSASVIAQTLVVPLDIISQHLQMLGQNQGHSVQTNKRGLERLEVAQPLKRSRVGASEEVIRAVYNKYGLRGFYKGYLTSIAVYGPNSALWWFFYDTYCHLIAPLAPTWVPHLAIQCFCGPLGGVSAALITNPFDLVRTRIQVNGDRFMPTARLLYQEEGFPAIFKGLSARLVQSVAFSFFIILGYESIKRMSLKEEHKKQMRW